MSQQPIDRSADLHRLREAGYDIAIINGHLVVRGVPYVDAHRNIKYGTLVPRELRLAGDETLRPGDHAVRFAVEGDDYPCDKDGQPLNLIRHSEERLKISDDIETRWIFSSKPAAGYADYYELVTTYVAVLENPAKAVAAGDPSVTAQRYMPAQMDPEDSVFCYVDTASSRAGLTEVNAKLQPDRIGIIGIGGAGSYVLDLVAKTGVDEIHLFDGDGLETHNAFRAPGAIPIEDLRKQPNKAQYWAERYAVIRRRVVAHPEYVNEKNLYELDGLTFVFLCLDSGSAKRTIVKHLVETGRPFIDVGIGVDKNDNASIFGQVRTTTSLPEARGHFDARVDFSDAGNDLYQTNIQIADLNALNACLAVMKWKKLRGFYADIEREVASVYMVEGNVVANDHA